LNYEGQILALVKEANPENPLAYVHSIVKPMAREKLDGYIAGCSDCKCVCSGPKSITMGDVNAAIMIIGESVIESQAKECESDYVYPFEGTSEGEMLDKLLNHYKVNHDELFWINAVNCFTHKEVNGKLIKRAPAKTEVDNCKVFLEYAIETVKPVAIILLGNIALNMFHKEAISQARGTWINVMGIPAMPTYHPSYLLHLQEKQDPEIVENYKIDFCEDVKAVFQYIQDNFPDNNVLLEKLEEE
jgi:uracil-DNA glycosylase family 4